jgi:hypothetical protein
MATGAVWRISPQNKMVHKWRLISILLEIKKKKSKKYIQRGRILTHAFRLKRLTTSEINNVYLFVSLAFYRLKSLGLFA